MINAAMARGRATEEAFRLAWFASRHLPESSVRSAFMMAADQVYRRNGTGVQRLRMNLKRVRPDFSTAKLEKITKAGMHSYMRYWMEAFRLPSWTTEQIRERFYLDNTKMLDEAMATGSGVIMVPGHLANWDSAGAWAADRYDGLATVAERLKPEGLFTQFLEYRRALGMNVLPLGEPDVVRSLARTLQRGGMVALLGDRDIGGNGVEVDFLGGRATLPAGPALLSTLTSAPILPIGLWYDGPKLRGHIYEPIIPNPGEDRATQVQQMTQKMAISLGQAIYEHPQDWHMMQKVWL
ncbi:MAG: phosphatidylinositol mannoside acyltransferase [Actinomycetota bacterium]|nr:phosphatidylinositol mannoside acyltransferase [Actinomycetota bacterium]